MSYEIVAALAGKLGNEGLHGDPADRLIVATAIHHGADLVSKDKAIRSFPKAHLHFCNSLFPNLAFSYSSSKRSFCLNFAKKMIACVSFSFPIPSIGIKRG